MSLFVISQFYILSSRGDPVLTKNYRNDIHLNSIQVFWDTIKSSKKVSEIKPCFNQNGINFMFVKHSELFFICTTKFNISPNLVFELIHRIISIIKDYCGCVSEDFIRKNIVLIYEILDEIIDYGLPQSTNTEQIKKYLHNEPVIEKTIISNLSIPKSFVKKKTVSSSNIAKPIIGNESNHEKKNEIYVDLMKRVVVLLSNNGYILNSSLNGSIKIKSYLTEKTRLRLALNQDLILRNKKKLNESISEENNNCNFHECADLKEFDNHHIIYFNPPIGEFVLMNYSASIDFLPPFRIQPLFKNNKSNQIELDVMIRSDFHTSKYGTNVHINIPVPQKNNGVSCIINSSSDRIESNAEFSQKDSIVRWIIRKFQGGTEKLLKIKIQLKEPISPTIKRQIGPISISFEIPFYTISNIRIESLKPTPGSSISLCKWVRYMLKSSNYICRL